MPIVQQLITVNKNTLLQHLDTSPKLSDVVSVVFFALTWLERPRCNQHLRFWISACSVLGDCIISVGAAVLLSGVTAHRMLDSFLQ